jgi:hypothetical protein
VNGNIFRKLLFRGFPPARANANANERMETRPHLCAILSMQSAATLDLPATPYRCRRYLPLLPVVV